MRRLKAKTKVKATSIVDLQYADDCVIAAHTEADLQNTLDAFSDAYKLLGLTVKVTKTKVHFQPAQPLTVTAPKIDIEGTTSRSRQTSMSKFNTGGFRTATKIESTGLQGSYSHHPLIWL